jgi:hypothetical protein
MGKTLLEIYILGQINSVHTPPHSPLENRVNIITPCKRVSELIKVNTFMGPQRNILPDDSFSPTEISSITCDF